VRPPLEITYTLDEDDWVAYFAHVRGKARRMRWPLRLANWVALVAVALVFTLNIIVLTALRTFSILDWPLAGILICCDVGALMLCVYAARQESERRWRLQVRRDVRQNIRAGLIKLDCSWRVIITPAGLTEITEVRRGDVGVRIEERTESAASWDAITCVEHTDRHGLIQVGTWGCCIVPIHAFARAEDFAEFMEIVRQCWSQPRQPPPALAAARAEQGIKRSDENIRTR
jgi:hypothetical protein